MTSNLSSIDRALLLAGLSDLSQAFVKGEQGRYGMRIPAEPYHDWDLVCGGAMRLIVEQNAEIERLRAALWDCRGALFRLGADVRDEIRYGSMDQATRTRLARRADIAAEAEKTARAAADSPAETGAPHSPLEAVKLARIEACTCGSADRPDYYDHAGLCPIYIEGFRINQEAPHK